MQSLNCFSLRGNTLDEKVTSMKSQSLAAVREVTALARQLEVSGRPTDRAVISWWEAEDVFALVETSKSKLLIESGKLATHALVTVVTESIARIDYDGDMYPYPIFRRQANPDSYISVGEPLNFLGLSRHGQAFDIDSIFTTSPVVGLRLLGDG